MHTVRWVSSKVVDHALSGIRLRVNKPKNYDSVSEAIYAKHREGGAAFIRDQMLLNDAVKRAEVDDMLEALAQITNKNSKLELIKEIDSACEFLSANCANTVRLVTSRLKGFDRFSYKHELENMNDEGLDTPLLLKMQWKTAIRQLEQQSSLRDVDFGLDPNMFARTRIKHVTDIACAINIVTKHFGSESINDSRRSMCKFLRR